MANQPKRYSATRAAEKQQQRYSGTARRRTANTRQAPHAARQLSKKQEQTQDPRRRSKYFPALDGIRTLAVAGVVVYHINAMALPGGLLGVTMFFVLSGFLITRLLIKEFVTTGKIDFKAFGIRRIRRLFPAVVAAILGTAILCTIFNHVMLTKMRPDILPSLLFFNNWWQILHNVSYFNALGDPSPLTHFWSLAIEGQFYLVWPLIVYLALRFGASNKVFRRGTLVLAAISAIAMAVMYSGGTDPSRVYYGTDTRVFSLLVGAWLAAVPARSLSARGIGQALHIIPTASAKNARQQHTPTWILDVIGGIGLISLVALMFTCNGYSAFLYRGGTQLCTVFTAMLIVPCLTERTVAAKVLSCKPLVWLGKRSYSIYLWHYPLLLLLNSTSDVTAKPWWVSALQIVLVVVVAALSYRFIEDPFRKGALDNMVSELRDSKSRPRGSVLRRYPQVAVGLLALVVAAGGIIFVPDTSALSEEGAAILAAGEDATNDTSSDGSTDSSDSDTSEDTGADDTTDASDDSTSSNSDFAANAYEVVMVGDSVSLRAVPNFESTFPYGHIDAQKNRQFSAGVEVYQQIVNEGKAGRIAVFALGTNGPMDDAAIDNLMSIVGDKRIAVFVNTRSPQPWVSQTNSTLASAAERYSNVRVIDWYSYSEGRNDLFDGDGTHLSSTGAQEYIDLIKSNIEGDLPVHLDSEESQQSLTDNAMTTVNTASETIKQGISNMLSKTLSPQTEKDGSSQD